MTINEKRTWGRREENPRRNVHSDDEDIDEAYLKLNGVNEP
jgi:hypothetical protein